MQRRVRYKEAINPDIMQGKLLWDVSGEVYQVEEWSSFHRWYICINTETDEEEVFTPSDITTMYIM